MIELVIVLTVLAVLTISVSLSMSFGRTSRQASDDARFFQENYDRLRTAAIHSQTPRGLMITPTGWRVARLDAVAQSWTATGREIPWRGAVFFRRKGPLVLAAVAGLPDVILLPDGRSTAFEIEFNMKQDISRCRSDGWQGVTCDGR